MKNFFIKAIFKPNNQSKEILANKISQMLKKLNDYKQDIFKDFYGNFNESGQYDRKLIINSDYNSIYHYLLEIPTDFILDKFIGYRCGFYTNIIDDKSIFISCAFENGLSNKDFVEIQFNETFFFHLNINNVINIIELLINIWQPFYCVLYSDDIELDYTNKYLLGYITYFNESAVSIFENMNTDNFYIKNNKYIFLNDNLIDDEIKRINEIRNINKKINVSPTWS